MPAIINSDSGVITGSAGLKIHGNSDGILEIQNNGVTSLVVANNYIRVPVGNTATRPSVASVGMLRFNNASNVFEGFNGNSWVSISTPLPVPVGNVEYLVVGGGGGGGTGVSGYMGAGGGAGGLLFGNISLTNGISYTITVGSGGTQNANGSPSSAFTSLVSYGGGYGGGGNQSNPRNTANFGAPGGSGGGTGANPNASVPTVGLGTPGQGNNGGAGGGGGGDPSLQAGGGGGASQVGTSGSPSALGKGGDGSPSLITGANVIYAGGGGGGTFNFPTTRGGDGGAGGGGPGGKYMSPPQAPGVSGNVNTGGGGGGGDAAAGQGGSGIVILAHSNTVSNAIVTAGLTYTLNTISRPGFLVYTFTAGTGNIYWA